MSVTVNNNGEFYPALADKNGYAPELQTCIERTVSQLLERTTSEQQPGMLLGKIQSGKTRAFIGVVALAFDNRYDVAVVLTKNNVALAQQTYERLSDDFERFAAADKLQIFDIMTLPDNLRKWELNQKIIIVVKKETHNLERLYAALHSNYPLLRDKRILIIDDEADLASVGFKRTACEGVEMRKIAGQIDELRRSLGTSDFLQVTATPYALYLQPEALVVEETSKVFKPIRPSFTELVPVGPSYIGGDYYFRESQAEDSIASYLYEPVLADEFEVVRRPDRRVFKLQKALTSPKIKSLRDAVVNFVVGGTIRRIQGDKVGTDRKKYSFIVHTESHRDAHAWQMRIVTDLITQLTAEAAHESKLSEDLIRTAYANLQQSLRLVGSAVPAFEEVKAEVHRALQEDHVMITVVNSKEAVDQLLDRSGQLKLRTPLNIFIGGQVLDRGITVRNLIGFYYGRTAKVAQQDTVLQHSRMFGYRPIEDLAVTRFYTTPDIYQVMSTIHEFDTALREAFDRGSQEDGVVFIHRDPQNRIVPCSPNKILLSTTTTLKPFKRLLPIGFNTLAKTRIKKKMDELDQQILTWVKVSDPDSAFLIGLDEAKMIVEKIWETLEFDTSNGYVGDLTAFLAAIEYLSKNCADGKLAGKVWAIVRTNRNIGRTRADGRYEDSPDTSGGENSEGMVARRIAGSLPALILLRENGTEDQGWRGSPFWWPVLIAPANSPTVVFASEFVE